MARQRIDLTGQRFHRLTVVRPAPSRGSRTYWHCVCACGREHVTATSSLVDGFVTSCGCARRESSAARMKTIARRGAQRYRPALATALDSLLATLDAQRAQLDAAMLYVRERCGEDHADMMAERISLAAHPAAPAGERPAESEGRCPGYTDATCHVCGAHPGEPCQRNE